MQLACDGVIEMDMRRDALPLAAQTVRALHSCWLPPAVGRESSDARRSELRRRWGGGLVDSRGSEAFSSSL